jgi:putative zinc finger/helix-turn-helix YgiT family protein
VEYVRLKETTLFKGQEIEYDVMYEYCEIADEYVSSDTMISVNDISLKDAYRKKNGLLTSEEIESIRQKYGISQSDLAILLGWGEKTITRYESHQVQDNAHDTILRKIDEDPEWYIALLKKSKEKFSASAYAKYFDAAKNLYESKHDDYLRRTIQAEYVKYENIDECCGNVLLDLDKVVEAICYFANSIKVKSLYKVKLMKMLWYADALAYKRHGHSMTGMVYKALPMGAVPLQYELIIDLKGVVYEEVEFGETSGYHFVSTPNHRYLHLTDEDKNVLDKIIEVFGTATKSQIVDSMHREQAYIETALNDIIQYKYAKQLSLS